jgi:hypothetical protein
VSALHLALHLATLACNVAVLVLLLMDRADKSDRK